MLDSFQDLLQQISDEHRRVVHSLRADSEELRARLARWESTDASGIQGRDTGQLLEAAHGLGDDQLSQPRGNTARQTSTPCRDGAPVSVIREDVDESEIPHSSSSSSQPPDQQRQVAMNVEAMPTERGKMKRYKTGEFILDDPPAREMASHGLRGLVQRLIQHDMFELVCSGLILMNTATMAVELQYYGTEAGYQVGYRGMSQPADGVWSSLRNVLPVVEKLFTVVFCFELALRIFGTGYIYFLRLPSWFDIIAVAGSVLDWVFVAVTATLSVDILRLMRLLRLLKALRILMKVRGALKLIIVSISATRSTLFWALYLLVLIQAVTALFMGIMLSEYIENSTKPEIERHEIYKYWGTFSFAFITMFEITFANWSPPCRALVTYVHPGYFLFFMMYRCIVGLAVLGVINAVFIQKTLKQAQSDHDQMLLRQQQEDERNRRELGLLFKRLDSSGDGQLGWDEFRGALQDPKTMVWLEALDVDVGDLHTLFKMLDGGQGNVDVDEFVGSMSQIQGPATSFDMLQVLNLSKNVHKMLAISGSAPLACSRGCGNAELQSLSDDVRKMLDFLDSAFPESGPSAASSCAWF